MEEPRLMGLCHKDAIRIRLVQISYIKSGLLESFNKCKKNEKSKIILNHSYNGDHLEVCSHVF